MRVEKADIAYRKRLIWRGIEDGQPSGGVYVLLNRTKGDSVRIFLIDDARRQEWWRRNDRIVNLRWIFCRNGILWRTLPNVTACVLF